MSYVTISYSFHNKCIYFMGGKLVPVLLIDDTESRLTLIYSYDCYQLSFITFVKFIPTSNDKYSSRYIS